MVEGLLVCVVVIGITCDVGRTVGVCCDDKYNIAEGLLVCVVVISIKL
jgi:hypothetical protein